MAKRLALKSFRLKNFKAIQDSGVVKFTPLTVLIGDNGSGKSSLVEGLETYWRIIVDDLNAAMGMWRGFEHIVNPPSGKLDERNEPSPSIEFELRGSLGSKAYRTSMSVGAEPQTNKASIEKECVYFSNRKLVERDRQGQFAILNGHSQPVTVGAERSIIAPWIFITDNASVNPRPAGFGVVTDLFDDILWWQFLAMNPFPMGAPQPIHGSGRRVRLRQDGADIAEYLLDIRRLDEDAYEGIIEALQFVLPYLKDLQPALTSELQRSVYLRMQEEDFYVPGWLLSTGTLRTLCLLSLFRHPQPPPLIVIEELENGLDPRCIHLIVEEIRNVVESGRSQVIVTTHSPYLLDLLPLESIVLVERVDGQPTFTRPGDDENLRRWSRKFGPGSLYTMQRLRNGASL